MMRACRLSSERSDDDPPTLLRSDTLYYLFCNDECTVAPFSGEVLVRHHISFCYAWQAPASAPDSGLVPKAQNRGDQ